MLMIQSVLGILLIYLHIVQLKYLLVLYLSIKVLKEKE